MNVNGQTLYKRGVQAFRDYAPVTRRSATGSTARFRWGKNLRGLLPRRALVPQRRTPTQRHVCDNPHDAAQPDLAPTAPQTTRTLFSAVSPSLAQPVSQACLDAINDPNRTFLGKRAARGVQEGRQGSTARFKVIMNEMPIQQYYILPYDRWEGFAAERADLLRVPPATTSRTWSS